MGVVSGRRQTFLAKEGDIKRSWHIVDASGIPLGRLAVEVANVLMGKHRPTYTPHVDTGDYVVITNASKVGMTGRKAEQRLKMRYTRYPGGLKTETYGQVRDRKPELLIGDAVRRMMPKNRLSRVMLKKLHVVEGAEHPYAAHNPAQLVVPLP
ncbi:MAG: 50S ribosomal protein L13 [Planctomycetes bacterium]|nr:50S ribosomal protein L13 [Planctomycetota bacterium]